MHSSGWIVELVRERLAIVTLVLVDALDGTNIDAGFVDAVAAKTCNDPGSSDSLRKKVAES